jgi:hypothetical protein
VHPVEPNDPRYIYFAYPSIVMQAADFADLSDAFLRSVLMLRLHFYTERLRNHTEEREGHCQYSKRGNWKIVFIFSCR